MFELCEHNCNSSLPSAQLWNPLFSAWCVFRGVRESLKCHLKCKGLFHPPGKIELHVSSVDEFSVLKQDSAWIYLNRCWCFGVNYGRYLHLRRDGLLCVCCFSCSLPFFQQDNAVASYSRARQFPNKHSVKKLQDGFFLQICIALLELLNKLEQRINFELCRKHCILDPIIIWHCYSSCVGECKVSSS